MLVESRLAQNGMQKWQVPILLVTNFLLTDSFKSGAPVSKCSTMIPHHRDNAPQIVPSPFILDADPTNSENGLYKIKLHSSNRDHFAGFFIQARVSSDNKTVGSFTEFPDDAKAINCLEIAD
ncbi:putative ferric-chelate reductase 1 [Halyomorpha halys]|uniref:putative ferric-chelate reductase 1 n=1 Tax=Halyomorpha halys TaxID=286706 RepID=UPI0034D262E8